MGLVKHHQIEVEERGWEDIDEKYVCEGCVEDEFLKQCIRDQVCATECDYCHATSSGDIAAPANAVLEVVSETVGYFYAEPTNSGMPYDGGWLVQPRDTDDVLLSLPLNCNDDLFADISGSFTNDAWVRAGGGHWATPHQHEIYEYSWLGFANWIKHETRFFFSRNAYPSGDYSDPHEIEPRQMLPLLGKLVGDLGLVRLVSFRDKLFRVRQRREGADWAADEDALGAPPSELARAGRMNPAGISYLYLALEQETAVAEVVRNGPAKVAIAEYETTRELRVLDLTVLPAEPSIFDADKRDQLEGLRFLRKFVDEICQPIEKDGREHIGYVPSQVVSEYFALVHRDGENAGVDGVVYPSAVNRGGRNLVLFPTRRGPDRQFSMVRFVACREEASN